MLAVRFARQVSGHAGALRNPCASKPRALRGCTFHSSTLLRNEMVRVTFIDDGKEVECTAPVGTTLLDAAWDNDIELEGACDKTLTCATCHVYIQEEFFDKLEEIEEDEEDMLDLAMGLEDNSRLGCQVKISKKLEGMRITVPDEADDF